MRSGRCDWELLLFCPTGRGGQQATRSYPLCPCCYSRPPLPGGHDAETPGRCSRCPHPEEHPIVAELAVCACPETADAGGKLLLDPLGGPHWRLVSSRGAFMMQFPPFVHALSLGGPCRCAASSCRQLRVEFERSFSPLEGGATTHEGCPSSDPLILAVCDSAAPAPRGGKGGGGKRGGKGGGKGGGRAKGGGKGGGRGGGGKGGR